MQKAFLVTTTSYIPQIRTEWYVADSSEEALLKAEQSVSLEYGESVKRDCSVNLDYTLDVGILSELALGFKVKVGDTVYLNDVYEGVSSPARIDSISIGENHFRSKIRLYFLFCVEISGVATNYKLFVDFQHTLGNPIQLKHKSFEVYPNQIAYIKSKLSADELNLLMQTKEQGDI